MSIKKEQGKLIISPQHLVEKPNDWFKVTSELAKILVLEKLAEHYPSGEKPIVNVYKELLSTNYALEKAEMEVIVDYTFWDKEGRKMSPLDLINPSYKLMRRDLRVVKSTARLLPYTGKLNLDLTSLNATPDYKLPRLRPKTGFTNDPDGIREKEATDLVLNAILLYKPTTDMKDRNSGLAVPFPSYASYLEFLRPVLTLDKTPSVGKIAEAAKHFRQFYDTLGKEDYQQLLHEAISHVYLGLGIEEDLKTIDSAENSFKTANFAKSANFLAGSAYYLADSIVETMALTVPTSGLQKLLQ